MTTDTIVALATPPGRGGVGIIRLSGPRALSVALQINENKPLSPRIALFCSFFNVDKQLIDQGLMLYFKAPHSFTGEDVVEIHAHGSPVVLDILIKECSALGARLARPGEFSERAFLNNKIDLTQAEAIADLIQASSHKAAHMALRTLQGEFSHKINQVNEAIVYLRLYVEAAIDFPEEEIDFLNDGKVAQLLNTLLTQLDILHKEANQGVIIREGLSIVIAGKPNAGKSTLINKLAAKEISIVTEIPGTTRDVLREHIMLDEIPLHIIDTAGIRESDNLVEKEGIKRAWEEIKQADCVLLVIDINSLEDYEDLFNELKSVLTKEIPIITIFNKIDTLDVSIQKIPQAVYLSAKSGEGMQHLKQKIKEVAGYQPEEGHYLARRRHLVALEKANDLLRKGQLQLIEHRAGELLAEDLRLAHQVLCEITGEFTSDDLLGEIFSSFCIGK